jgi:hypothetical protein
VAEQNPALLSHLGRGQKSLTPIPKTYEANTLENLQAFAASPAEPGENRDAIFPGIHRTYKFSLLTLGWTVNEATFAFFLTDISQLADERRRFTLSAADIKLISPNIRTAPVFRSRADSKLTADIYSRISVLVNELARPPQDSWAFRYMTKMFDMADSSHRFQTAEKLREKGAIRDGRDWVRHDDLGREERWLPLMEAKMIGIYDHRAGSYETRTDARGSRVLPETTQANYSSREYEAEPYYWVLQRDVEDRMSGRPWSRKWLMGWKDVTTATTERTAVAAAFPWSAVAHSIRVMFVHGGSVPPAVLIANLSSLVTDYVVRQKLSYLHLTVEILKQIPILPPSSYAPADLAFIVPRVLELTYSSHSMAPFARDLGCDSPPFRWDEDRRAHLRAELDAWYARAYGLTRDELRYILDPADVKGPDYPSETFRVLKTNEIRRFGEYRTARLVLQAWDELAAKRKVVA